MSFIEFNSWDEMNAKMAEHEKIANSNVLPRQRDIVHGSYWLRASGSTIVYGRVFTEAEANKGQTRESKRALRDRYERGYRFSIAHTVWYPDGELGDHHLSVIWPITKEEFELAKATGWHPTGEQWEREMLLRVHREATEAVAARNDTDPDTGSPQEESP